MPCVIEYETGPVLRNDSEGLRRQNWRPALRCGRQPNLAPSAVYATAFFD